MKCADPLFTSWLIKPLYVGDLNSDSNSVENAFKLYVSSKRYLVWGSYNLLIFKFNSKTLAHRVYETFPDGEIYSFDLLIREFCLLWDKEKGEISFTFFGNAI